ncbi:mercury(II) reductase [Mycobacterium shinjukuense]|uniref:Mercuric reductase n=1 Tax=Mycobacterium shinjukuense TaxID=398694 RepID=A0A7I7MQ19_9MYCO|nr:mercury(II) reductase [Mycobacterium shinjukuense]MCV6986933.1 mercury(II) reductase [Mycobacterium shinjukuense]ORB71166.1 mercury(II) reductase [Mycobacterium shinjukuense]BBX73623.1 mercuric reductase MerA [Mycobacterium shinjukuense]
MRYDLAIIGSGGAGFAAAIAARTKGRSVVMVERGTVGGTCVNTGCVPSKALLAAAEARHVSQEARFPGITSAPFGVDPRRLIGGKDELVAALRAVRYRDVAAAYGWNMVAGTARFVDGPMLDVALSAGGTERLEAQHYVIATGAAPWAPPVDGLAEAGYLTSTTAMDLDALPSSMVVLGGNAVGLEQAQLWARLGVDVTVVEVLDRLAPFEEPEISTMIEEALGGEGVGVLTGAAVTRVRRDHRGYRITYTGATRAAGELRAEQLLVATGRRPVTEALNLSAVGVKTGTAGQVLVDEYLRTNNRRIWAAGDVTGAPQFVYVAAAHGTLVVDNAFDAAQRSPDYSALPRVTFTSPAIAAAGLTEHQALDAGYECECRVLPLEYVPRAIINRDTRGLIKLVAERGSGRLLGAHVIADGAGDVIVAAVSALASGATIAQLAEQWSPYLTMAEGLKLASQTFTRDVTKLSCCA